METTEKNTNAFLVCYLSCSDIIVLDISENDFFLVEDVNGDVATRVQIIQLVRGECLDVLLTN